MNDSSHGDITPLLEAAATAHELFCSLVDGGFNEAQAIRLTAYVMLGHPTEGT
jgi:hypothetical protein